MSPCSNHNKLKPVHSLRSIPCVFDSKGLVITGPDSVDVWFSGHSLTGPQFCGCSTRRPTPAEGRRNLGASSSLCSSEWTFPNPALAPGPSPSPSPALSRAPGPALSRAPARGCWRGSGASAWLHDPCCDLFGGWRGEIILKLPTPTLRVMPEQQRRENKAETKTKAYHWTPSPPESSLGSCRPPARPNTPLQSLNRSISSNELRFFIQL